MVYFIRAIADHVLSLYIEINCSFKEFCQRIFKRSKLIGICSFFWQFYGKTFWEGVQGPNEVIYLPNGLLHTVLNLEDNVAITENYLFVDALPGKCKFYSPIQIIRVFTKIG